MARDELAAKYKEKAVVEAIQFDGWNINEIWESFGAADIYGPTESNPDWLIIRTSGGPRRVDPTDWIVKNDKGLLNCYDDRGFTDRYELVQE